MKTINLNIVLFIVTFAFVACTTKTQQHKQETIVVDTLIIEQDSFIPDEAYIESLIREDQNKRNLMSWIDTSSSPLFYETIHDDGLILLYRVIPLGHKTSVVMIEDMNIADYGDDICYSDSNGVIYEHKGYYEILDDSTVNIFVDELYSNHFFKNDSVAYEPIYHKKYVYRYKLSGLEWSRTKADTTIVMDEREKSLCEDIWKYTE